MNGKATVAPPPADPRAAAAGTEIDQIGQNIAAVQAFYAREEDKVSTAQRHAERIGSLVGRPVFGVAILIVVGAWIALNEALRASGRAVLDPAPYAWLQGIVGLSALLTTTVVLTKQNRLAKLDEQRAHLDLKVTLLIEQKAAKLIDLLEELRRDLPNVRDRHDGGAAVMQQAKNPELVLAALDEFAVPPQADKPAPLLTAADRPAAGLAPPPRSENP